MSTPAIAMIVFLLFSYTSIAQVGDGGEAIKMVRAHSSFDTLSAANKKVLVQKISVESDTMLFKSFFRISEVPDFQFSTEGLYDSSRLVFKKRNVALVKKNNDLHIEKFLFPSDQVEVFTFKDYRCILIFGKPFFCEGRLCGDITVLGLIMNVKKNKEYCFEINSSFNDLKKLIPCIDDNFNKTGKLSIPMATSDKGSGTKISWVDPFAAL